MKSKIFRLLKGIFFLALVGLNPSGLYAQDENIIQIRTFDQKLQIFPGIDISLDGQIFFTMNETGSAIVEIADSNLPPDMIFIGDSTLEAESWNYSKGILEIIIRPRSTKVISVLVKNQENKPLEGLTIFYQSNEPITAVTDGEGHFEMTVPIGDDLNNANAFSLEGYILSDMQFVGLEGEFIVEMIPSVKSATTPIEITQEMTPVDFDPATLDTLSSLSDFYAAIHNLDMNNLDSDLKAKIDAKFLELLGSMSDSLMQGSGIFFSGMITDSSLVTDDLALLIDQAEKEEHYLAENRNKFNESINIIGEKMADGSKDLDDEERAEMLLELDRLGKILAENKRSFFANQADLEAILESLSNNILNIVQLEKQLSISEQQRLADQQIFQKRLLIGLSIVIGLALLTMLLIYFVRKFSRQKTELSIANARVKQVNENLEVLVAEKTFSLELTNRELDTFLYKSSHDLKRPLSTIIGLYNVAKLTLEKSALTLFEKTSETAQRMDRMLQKLMMVSSISNPSELENIDFEKKIEEARSDFEDIINGDEVLFESVISPEVRFRSHPNLVFIIIRNLLENALLFSKLRLDTHPKVVIKVEQDESSTVIKMLDNGPGINEEIYDKMWDMFYVGNPASKGNGLGLYIVKKAVKALGGEIEVVSVEGEFTEFAVTLPSIDYDDESEEKNKIESEEYSPVT